MKVVKIVCMNAFWRKADQGAHTQPILQPVQRLWRALRGWLHAPRILWRQETAERCVTIELQRWLPVGVFVLALAWYLLNPVPVAIIAVVSVGGVLLCAFGWARTQAREVRAWRQLRSAAMQVGDELEEQIGLENTSWLPVVWAEFVDHSNLPGYTVSSARAADAQAEVEWRAHTICTRRGVFVLGPWELRMGEPFGIFIVRQVVRQRQEILVYPPLAVLPEHVLLHRSALGNHRPLNQPLPSETIASNSVRAYAPGDPLRHVHWRTSARQRDLYVKVFSPEAASNVWLLADFDAIAHTQPPAFASEETMVTVVASLAADLLHQNLSVGLYANAQRETVVLPRAGQAHLWNILQALAPLYAQQGHPLVDVLPRVRTLVGSGDVWILVTPSLSPEWLAALRSAARSQGGRGRAAVIVLDPASFGAPVEANEAQIFSALLAEQGIPANVLRREDVRLLSGAYGEISRWEFSVLGTGRALARNRPRMPGGTAFQGKGQG